MKVLTLHQPWATLIAEGVKTIETRPWSTNYRGPLAIHAAKTTEHIGWAGGDGWWYGGKLWQSNERGDVRGGPIEVPLGVIVCVVDLVDVVPMVDRFTWLDRLFLQDASDGLHLYSPATGRALCVETQRPFGHFAPGRFAWLLENVRKLDEPVPHRGLQSITNLPTSQRNEVLEQIEVDA